MGLGACSKQAVESGFPKTSRVSDLPDDLEVEGELLRARRSTDDLFRFCDISLPLANFTLSSRDRLGRHVLERSDTGQRTGGEPDYIDRNLILPSRPRGRGGLSRQA